jgi:hypothetical protein
MRRVRHAKGSKIINNTIEEFTNTGISVRWDARRAYIAENTIKSLESSQGCGIALDFKEAAPGEKFTVKNNLVEVRRGTCVSARYADNVLMEDNKLFGRNGIDCVSGNKGMVYSGNYIEGHGCDAGVGINIGPSQGRCVLRQYRIKKFDVGIFSSSSSSIDDENNELTDCGRLKSIGG